ncbi:mannitol dehydrogenase family protein [Pseudohalioglobus lutimaris]|nr:mannitol dehydrogenase family protein [Pseudohalioglobus lutimaris]
MKRLSNGNLAAVTAGVATPGYDRNTLKPGILHLGLGAFHRAHQAVYTDTAIARSGGDWGIIGVSMRSDRVTQQLAPQDGLYSVLSENQNLRELRVIGCLQRVLAAPRSPAAVTGLLADPAIRVVTLTVTEKGYCLGEDGWTLARALPSVKQDLADPQLATTAIGVLARGLAQRYHSGGAPINVISCDNLGENSARLRAVLLQYMASAFAEAVDWVENEVAFPCSMVDRIVPATTEAGLQRQAALIGLQDAGAVATEPFCQWIIEDKLATDVPDWAAAGAQFVNDIRPYEEIKLRLLNASHSSIALAGLLAGKETVADVMADPTMAGEITELMSRELLPALTAPEGFDLFTYRDQLLERFSNPCLQHRCAQIATDSTEKIRQRWLGTLMAQAGDTLLLRSLARWCFWVLETDLPIDDPRAETLLALRAKPSPDSERLAAALACVGITPRQNGLDEHRLQCLREHIAGLQRAGHS